MELPPLVSARLLRRYKRFLADVELDSGETMTVHCPNTGAMTGCAEPGSRVWLSQSDNPRRKYRYTWELVETAAGHRACIHSARANDLVEEALRAGVVDELRGFEALAREVRLGTEGSRLDFLLQMPDAVHCYMEVKSVTLYWQRGMGLFPDAKSDRAARHLRELMAAVAAGHRAVLFFAVLHTGIDTVAPADAIDPRYAETFREALAAGVEVLAYAASISDSGLALQRRLPVLDRQPASA